MKSRIREIRKAKGFTAQALADRCGTTHATISRLEGGKQAITVDWIRQIAAVLDVEPMDLIEAKSDIAINVIPGAIKIDAALRTAKEADWLIARIAELKSVLQGEPEQSEDGKVVQITWGK